LFEEKSDSHVLRVRAAAETDYMGEDAGRDLTQKFTLRAS